MDFGKQQPSKQEILLTTIHNQDNVVEVYLNDAEQLITEMIHLSNHRVKLYQFEVSQYKKRPELYNLLNSF